VDAYYADLPSSPCRHCELVVAVSSPAKRGVIQKAHVDALRKPRLIGIACPGSKYVRTLWQNTKKIIAYAYASEAVAGLATMRCHATQQHKSTVNIRICSAPSPRGLGGRSKAPCTQRMGGRCRAARVAEAPPASKSGPREADDAEDSGSSTYDRLNGVMMQGARWTSSAVAPQAASRFSES
jgi:hypothetical protein